MLKRDECDDDFLLGVGGSDIRFGKTLTFVLDHVILYRLCTLEIHIYIYDAFISQS
jgi:hypothetical protein